MSVAPLPSPSLADRVAQLNARWRGGDTAEVLRAAVCDEFPGRTALLSSFGAEAAVTLHLLAAVAPDTPVLFLDTGMHFGQTPAYRDDLVARLGLTDVRALAPVGAAEADPRGDLWRRDSDACCDLRKVRPLAEAAPGFDCLIGGRKRFHGGDRARLPLFELTDGQVRLNILAEWDADRLEAYRARARPARAPPCRPGASAPSAAGPAPSRARRTRACGRAAGRGRRRPSAASTSRASPSRNRPEPRPVRAPPKAAPCPGCRPRSRRGFRGAGSGRRWCPPRSGARARR